MTLIATYKVNDIPVLVGDVLLTGLDEKNYCKKITKVSPNFVIGWTGRKFNAVQVFKALIPRFKNKAVSKAEVEEFLTNFPVASFVGEAGENKLIMSGWVVDGNGQHPFVWNSDYNRQGIDFLVSDPNENYLNGSGAAYFQTLITKRDGIGDIVARNETELTKIAILTELGYLVANEFLDTELWADDRFGFGYEALIHNGNEFEYISDTCFFPVDIACNEMGEPLTRSNIHTYLQKYKALDEMAVFEMVSVSDASREGFFVGIGLEATETDKKIMRSMITNNSSLPLPKFLCILLRCSINGEGVCRGPLVVPIESDLVRYSEGNNKITFGFKPAFGDYFSKWMQAFLKEKRNS